MTTDRPHPPGEAGGGYDEGDLEYDLAHDAEQAGGRGEPDPAAHHEPPVYVATQTRGYDGDLGYDLAHDVPGR